MRLSLGVRAAIVSMLLLATFLNLLGMDHERLTYYHNGLERRLSDVHGTVVRGILA